MSKHAFVSTCVSYLVKVCLSARLLQKLFGLGAAARHMWHVDTRFKVRFLLLIFCCWCCSCCNSYWPNKL